MSSIGLLVVATGATACGSEATTTAGGCECPERQGTFPARISLACFKQEFPEEARSYDEAIALVVSVCSQGWGGTERVGCGKRIVTQGGGYGGRVYVYDETTRALQGARMSGDTTWGVCQTFGYEAGALPDCNEGTVCSLCETGVDACLPG